MDDGLFFSGVLAYSKWKALRWLSFGKLIEALGIACSSCRFGGIGLGAFLTEAVSVLPLRLGYAGIVNAVFYHLLKFTSRAVNHGPDRGV
jgi:hypothetical protein